MNCAEFARTIEDYVAGVLPQTTRDEVNTHATICPRCGDLLRDVEEAAAFVRLSVPQIEPPQQLRSRILTAARASANDAPARLDALPRPTQPSRRPWWRRISLSQLAAALSLVTLLAVVALAGWVVALQNELGRQMAENERLSQQVAQHQQLLTLLAAPGNYERVLAGSEQAPQARGQLFYYPSRRQAVLLTTNLPPAGAGRAYQVWGRGQSGPVSLGLLVVDETGTGRAVLESPVPLSQFEVVGISLEPAGGSPQPTGPRMMLGSLS